MKRILLPLMAMSIALTSCSRDNDDVTNPTTPPTNNPATPPTNPVEQRKKIKSIEFQSPSFDVLSQIPDDAYPFIGGSFNFNGDLLTYITAQNIIYNVIYDGDKIVSLGDDIKFTYNPNGTIKSAIQKVHYPNPAEIFREYTYVNSETIKVREVKKSINQSDVVKEYTLTMYNDNLLEKQIINLANSHIKQVYNYSYDERENPIRNIKGMAALALELDFIEGNYSFGAYSLLKAFKNNAIHIQKHYRYTNHDTPFSSDDYPNMYYYFNYLYDNAGYIQAIYTKVSKSTNAVVRGNDWEYEYIYNIHYYND